MLSLLSSLQTVLFDWKKTKYFLQIDTKGLGCMISFDLPFLIETVQKHNALLIHFEHPILSYGEAYLCF